MKKTLLFLSIILFATEVISQNVFAARPFSKSITNPKYERKQNPNLYITHIELNDEETLISFIYDNTRNSRSEEIWLGQTAQTALYIEADNGRVYKFKRYGNIGSVDNKTIIPPKSKHKFQVRFDALPANTRQFNLIEGRIRNDQNPFNFYGVQMRSNDPNVELVRVVKDYNAFRVFNNQSETWERFKKENNTVIINSDYRSGAIIIRDNGELNRYTVRSVKRQDDHQKIQLIDNKGLEVTFYLYNKDDKGLIINHPDHPFYQLARR